MVVVPTFEFSKCETIWKCCLPKEIVQFFLSRSWVGHGDQFIFDLYLLQCGDSMEFVVSLSLTGF